jgi:hypothetical protein
MCEECWEAPVQFVAYFNKPGGKLWRPPHRAATAPSPTDVTPPPPPRFSCVDPAAASTPPEKVA